MDPKDAQSFLFIVNSLFFDHYVQNKMSLLTFPEVLSDNSISPRAVLSNMLTLNNRNLFHLKLP